MDAQRAARYILQRNDNMASATDERHLPDVRCVWVFCYVAELS
jgi:hypothetical protein